VLAGTILIVMTASFSLKFIISLAFLILTSCLQRVQSSSILQNEVAAVCKSSSTKATTTKNLNESFKPRRRVLILDVDNTLYNEREITADSRASSARTADSRASSSGGCLGIEQQIIANTHEFGQSHPSLNLSPKECDKLYLTHGSTVEGIRHLLLKNGHDAEFIHGVLREYYHQIYHDIDMSCLLPSSDNGSGSGSETGYNHSASRKRRKVIRDLLEHMPHPIYFASNSPKAHVLKVLSILGLHNVKYEGIITPDTANDGYRNNNGDGDGQHLSYPTKFDPQDYFQTLLEWYDPTENELVLIDDSQMNLKKAKTIGIHGILVNKPEAMNLEEALNSFLGHIESNLLTNEKRSEDESEQKEIYKFDSVQYLQSKNRVDLAAIHPSVWQKMTKTIFNHDNTTNDRMDFVRIVDVGAGLLSMLDLILNGGGGKEPLVGEMRDGSSLEYIAYESNQELLETCKDRLISMGFQEEKKGKLIGGKGNCDESVDEYIFERKGRKKSSGVNVKVLLRVKDFTESPLKREEHPHLIVGCCFADLFDPDILATSLMQFTRHCAIGGGVDSDKDRMNDILVYFPITFDGSTQFLPPKPFSFDNNEKGATIPSDTKSFQLYADSLIQNHGHNLDPTLLIDSMNEIGATLLTSATSVWKIDPNENEYLWSTMLYFFGTSAAPEIMRHNWDSVGWINRARRNHPKIHVRNQDLLFKLPPADSTDQKQSLSQNGSFSCLADTSEEVEQIEFTSPHVVGKKRINGDSFNEIGPGQVEIKSICSLISSGTELKIFKGLFEDAALDVNIKGMADESMKYPLSYGYSLVGVVTRCAADVEDSEDLIGKMVFTFSPHASHVVVDREGVHVVPEGIRAEDAIFMPSVETALSLTHDAHLRLGENVAVYGQGLIGLLVNGILSRQQVQSPSGNFGMTTAFDTISDRLAMASTMGASQVLLPQEAASSGPFDVSIEVSGNYRALQSAIDHTRNGGRIVVGSWYGNSDVTLKLGIDFHRSHKTIKTSQVSTIPAELSTLWSKDRRFSFTWDLVQTLKPSALITKRVTLDEAQEAYDLLDNGEEIAIAFKYY